MERIEAAGVASDAAARRGAELDERIRELHERHHELTAILLNGRAGGSGSSQEQVRRAEELATLASIRAAEAVSRAAARYLRSADAHERAARMHTLLTETGAGDIEKHRARASEHLQRAAGDRAAASAITGRQQPGHRRGGTA